MSRRSPGLFDLLFEAPWWASVALAVIAFVSLRYVFPALVSKQSIPVGAFVHGLKEAAGFVAVVLLLPAPVAAFRQFREGRLVDRQTGIDSIRALSWQEFETLLAEAYRRQGYSVEKRGGSQPDGGIDLILHRDGKVLVQCKHWKAQRVGVKEARELLGVVHAEKAIGGILVTSGQYTPEARDFANGQPLTLVDDRALVSLLASVRRARSTQASPEPTPAAPRSSAPTCPKCGSPMVLRTAARGASPGSQFWGCSTYPRCRGTVSA